MNVIKSFVPIYVRFLAAGIMFVLCALICFSAGKVIGGIAFVAIAGLCVANWAGRRQVYKEKACMEQPEKE